VDGTVLNIYDYLSPPIQSFATNTGENWQFTDTINQNSTNPTTSVAKPI
jgi:hypothetical protein